MYSDKNNNEFDSAHLEKWLESLFLDPFTSILDQTQFRVDLFDTANAMIIEALLPNHLTSEISVYLEGTQVIIKTRHLEPKERKVNFPFKITSHKVTASFENGILEIVISKKEKGNFTNRFVVIK